MKISLTNGFYQVYEFEETHNHILATGTMAQYLRSHRKVIDSIVTWKYNLDATEPKNAGRIPTIQYTNGPSRKSHMHWIPTAQLSSAATEHWNLYLYYDDRVESSLLPWTGAKLTNLLWTICSYGVTAVLLPSWSTFPTPSSPYVLTADRMKKDCSHQTRFLTFAP